MTIVPQLLLGLSLASGAGLRAFLPYLAFALLLFYDGWRVWKKVRGMGKPKQSLGFRADNRRKKQKATGA